MAITKGNLTKKQLRPGGNIVDFSITPDGKRQVYLEVHKNNPKLMEKVLTTKLITEIEVEYEEFALVNEGKGNTLVVKEIKVV